HGEGSYFCNQCGAGSGLILIRKLHGWDHKTACDEIDKIIGSTSTPVSAPAASPGKPDEKRAEAVKRALAQAVDAAVVDAYLDRRGIAGRSPILQGHARCPYFNDRKQFVGHFPAIVAPLLGPDGT